VSGKDARDAGLDVARRFASALDQEDYDAARALLADDCVYTIRGKDLRGRDAIIEPYKGNRDEAARMGSSFGLAQVP